MQRNACVCPLHTELLYGFNGVTWKYLLIILIHILQALGHQYVQNLEKSVDLDIYFGNSTTPDQMQTTDAGFKMDLDHVWQLVFLY